MNLSQDLQGLKKKAKETFLYALSALFLGIAIGAIDAVFGRVLLFITDFRSAHVVVLLPFLPLAGLGIVWLYRHFNETAAKGMTLVMEAGQGNSLGRTSFPLTDYSFSHKKSRKKILDHMLQSAAFVTYIPDFSLLQ